MEVVYFIIRYTPFWAVPLLMISLEFAYIYWLKSLRKMALSFILLGFISFLMTAFYYWAGGPDNAVKEFMAYVKLFLEYSGTMQ